MIGVLEEWGLLPSDVARDYNRLRRLRNDAIHYNVPRLDHASRHEALEAVLLVQQIERLFHPSASQLIPGIAGAEFLRLDVEVEPFVRHFFIPACALVSRLHEWVSFDPLTILDDVDYEDPEGPPRVNR